jgi:hypothetical protein
LIVDAVIVSLLGLLAGPTFPLILDIATNPNTRQTPGVSTSGVIDCMLMPWKDAKPSPRTSPGGAVDGPRHWVSPNFEDAASPHLTLLFHRSSVGAIGGGERRQVLPRLSH